MSRIKYYSFIKDKGINDMLFDIHDISYSKKIDIISDLLNEYEPEIINYALNDFYSKYISKNRVKVFRIKNTLKYLCELYMTLTKVR